jgi:hypothetical protein
MLPFDVPFTMYGMDVFTALELPKVLFPLNPQVHSLPFTSIAAVLL